MKQLEIKTNKRLLIVEVPENTLNYWGLEKVVNALINSTIHIEKQILVNDTIPNYKFICKGFDLTEDVAKGFLHQSIHTGLFAHYVKDIPVNTYCYKTALEAFGAVIYAYGYHWGENPHEKELDSCSEYTDMFTIAKRARKYEEAQARTFNPSKCIIFEIV